MAVRLNQLTSAEETSGFLDVLSEIRIFEMGWIELNAGIKRLKSWHALCFSFRGKEMYESLTFLDQSSGRFTPLEEGGPKESF